MKRLMPAILLLVFCACEAVEPPPPLGIAPFVGTWRVDMDRTIEALKKKYDYRVDKRMSRMTQSLMETVRVRVTERDLTYIRGGQETTLRFAVQSTTTKSTTVVVKEGGKETIFVLTPSRDGAMTLESSATDDMDLYIWRKTKAPQPPAEK